jgi:GNAT superfamily N-acetyltransferase
MRLMRDLSVRIAAPDELERVRTTYAAWDYGGGADSADTIFVAEGAGEFRGLVRLTCEHGTTMLRGMQVAPDARRQGVGTRLLETFVAQLGGEECYCIPYSHLIAFYGSQGFEVQPRELAPGFLVERLAGYRARGLDVVLMRRPQSSGG